MGGALRCHWGWSADRCGTVSVLHLARQPSFGLPSGRFLVVSLITMVHHKTGKIGKRCGVNTLGKTHLKENLGWETAQAYFIVVQGKKLRGARLNGFFSPQTWEPHEVAGGALPWSVTFVHGDPGLP